MRPIPLHGVRQGNGRVFIVQADRPEAADQCLFSSQLRKGWLSEQEPHISCKAM